MFPRLENARIDWEQDHPSSHAFGDVYYDKTAGLDESCYVFLTQNQLAQRFEAMNDHLSSDHFTVAETGFGTGLNFLLTWQLWNKVVSRPGCVLHFVSVERWPLTREDLQRSLLSWPDLHSVAQELVEHYPPALHGTHRLLLNGGKIRLTLLLGDAEERIASSAFLADAWFLDGFAPAKNPDLWTTELFGLIAQRSNYGATFSTFSSAGMIRRGLQEIGFRVEKVAGFGRKRDMLRGTYERPALNPFRVIFAKTPWLVPPYGDVRHERERQSEQAQEAVIIGAGLAGCHLAWNLVSRGWRVRIYDTKGIASGASGNPQGVLYTKLGVTYSPQTRLQLMSLLHSQRFYRELAKRHNAKFWTPCGVLQLADSENEQLRQQKFLENNQYPPELLRSVDAEEASQLAGSPLPHSGLFFPGSGAVEPQKLCHLLLEDAGIEVVTRKVGRLHFSIDRVWQLYDEEGALLDSAPSVVLACASAAKWFSQTGTLPVKDVRGQITQLPAPEKLSLKTVLCGEGYIAPPAKGMLCTGATFQHSRQDSVPTAEDHLSNLQQAVKLLPYWRDQILSTPRELLSGRVGFRCSTADFLPIIGALPKDEASTVTESELDCNLAEAHYWPGLYSTLGHGSKGLATTTLAAELLADLMTGQPIAVGAEVFKVIAPARFSNKRRKARKQTRSGN